MNIKKVLCAQAIILAAFLFLSACSGGLQAKIEESENSYGVVFDLTLEEFNAGMSEARRLVLKEKGGTGEAEDFDMSMWFTDSDIYDENGAEYERYVANPAIYAKGLSIFVSIDRESGKLRDMLVYCVGKGMEDEYTNSYFLTYAVYTVLTVYSGAEVQKAEELVELLRENIHYASSEEPMNYIAAKGVCWYYYVTEENAHMICCRPLGEDLGENRIEFS